MLINHNFLIVNSQTPFVFIVSLFLSSLFSLSFPRRRESRGKRNGRSYSISRDKSIQAGLFLSIKFIFHSLFHFFICFSLNIASWIY